MSTMAWIQPLRDDRDGARRQQKMVFLDLVTKPGCRGFSQRMMRPPRVSLGRAWPRRERFLIHWAQLKRFPQSHWTSRPSFLSE
ncbi:hypothetical protein [Sulfobacillus harzensis]|uniref:Uncharacterized protein n=1 Tax=Sulfobacillus harzensis TaxID=2729629 RepID=A0A7Y0L4E5_9FIRM|nr:hypothetical protein [Sulfobacillus harzensis]NMP22466.1 hypothetical protein [Sulfobacillus harzensis]